MATQVCKPGARIVGVDEGFVLDVSGEAVEPKPNLCQ